MERKQGIDVSAHQGKIDWEAAKTDGVEFAILRCGFGNDEPTQDDAQFERNASECDRLGIPWGAYLYSYALTLEEAESELRHILRLLKGKRPLYPVYLDMEDADGYKAKYGGVDNAMCAAVCAHVCAGLEAAGYYAGIYASKDWLTNRLNDPSLDRYDKWLAQWYDRPTYEGQFGLWQYASDGVVKGISGRVDRNQTTGYRDYPAAIREAGLNGWDKPAPAPEPAPEPVPGAAIKAGDAVRYAGRLYGDSYGGNPGKTVDGTFPVDRVIEGRAYGVHTASGWLEAAKCRKASPTPAAPAAGAPSEPARPAEPATPVLRDEPILRIGAKVRYSGRVYATATGSGAGASVSGTYEVTRYLPERPYGVHIGGLGWVKPGDCEVIG